MVRRMDGKGEHAPAKLWPCVAGQAGNFTNKYSHWPNEKTCVKSILHSPNDDDDDYQ